MNLELEKVVETNETLQPMVSLFSVFLKRDREHHQNPTLPRLESPIERESVAGLVRRAESYSYDGHDDKVSLRGASGEIALHLQREIQDRLLKAGVQAIEARISHLAYAQEIAAAMLQRQQASAIIAARQKIVEGAVGMVEMALDMLSKRSVVLKCSPEFGTQGR